MTLDEIKECVETIRDESLASRYRDMAISALSKPILEAEALAGEEVSSLLRYADQAAMGGKMSMTRQLRQVESVSTLVRHVFITAIIKQLSAHGLHTHYYASASPAFLHISWAPKSLSELGGL